ncbi:hypothetical protein G7K_5858-t1 [Saitoella complicata NRRL Y-17804]|uniref:Uncharacterized protein n=1 Tax=Saitoella complicata (strain BCRC 22490 / CBS 7301 / JCM 7358 / NBRC 10748 / NRRL Y-17804) TaxID=698492 RepID=A0A0E9NQR7_SAICN|nr:hypothetical protein G7K_5858-t1 [Saitoella complicata NRRL Y-17804]
MAHDSRDHPTLHLLIPRLPPLIRYLPHQQIIRIAFLERGILVSPLISPPGGVEEGASLGAPRRGRVGPQVEHPSGSDVEKDKAMRHPTIIRRSRCPSTSSPSTHPT